MPPPDRPPVTPPRRSPAAPAAKDPPWAVGAIWAVGVLGTPLAGLGLHLAWRHRRPRGAVQALRAAGVGAVLWLAAVAALGGVPGRAPTDAGSAPGSAPPATAATGTGVKWIPPQVRFTQIMVAYARPGGITKVRRSRAEALDLARSLVARIRKGASMERLVDEFTDDRGEDGKPFNEGSYSMSRSQPAVEAIKRTAFGLDVGELADEPVDSGYAYHVIRRDA